jgi:hypothetical protein
MHAIQRSTAKIFSAGMRPILVIAVYCLFLSAEAFNWGVTQCSSPSHASGRAKPDPEGVEVFTTEDGMFHITSSRPIKGFLLTGKDVSFSEIPEHATLTNVCGQGDNGVSHSNSSPRNAISVRYTCANGIESVKLQIYLVFGYRIPYLPLSGNVKCGTITTTAEAETTPVTEVDILMTPDSEPTAR